MRSIHVTHSIPASPEAVFDLLTDHANYKRFRGVSGSELLREGDPTPNGVGAVRRIRSTPFRFDEEVTAYERPTRFEYLIVDLNVPFEHHGGTIRLSADGDRTQVDWRSSYTVPTPLVGGLQEAIWKPALTRGFRRVLEDVERMTTAA
jgi:uncharacterized protein YndB with AHSA1/START domain